MDLLDLLIRMLGLILQVLGLLLTWTGFRSLTQLQLKVASTPVLLPPRPHAFTKDKPPLAALAALAKSEALAEQRFDRHYRELRFLSAVTLQRLMARAGWGVENNIYQLYHRGYVAVQGGAQDCPYTYMADMAAGRYKLPWDVQVTDGTSCGFEAPTRAYMGHETHPLAPASAPAAAASPFKKVA